MMNRKEPVKDTHREEVSILSVALFFTQFQDPLHIVIPVLFHDDLRRDASRGGSLRACLNEIIRQDWLLLIDQKTIYFLGKLRSCLIALWLVP
jgi:hypothetical protein